ncbi:phospholipase D-like domain-containing protein [Sphingomonas sp. MMS24-JH45]
MDAPARQPIVPQPAFDVDGNRLTLLDTGPRRLDAVLDLIARARTSLRMIFYIYADDATGRRVNAALIEAAGHGIAVSLVVDGFGASTDAAPSSARWRKRAWRSAARSALRSPLSAQEPPEAGARRCRHARCSHHRRRLQYRGRLFRHPRRPGVAPTWDCCVEAGRLAHGGLFRRAGAGDPQWRARAPPQSRARPLRTTEGRLRWVIGGPTRRLSPWARAIKRDMRHARRIDLIAAYFMPSPMLLRRIERAGRSRGRKGRADVRVVTASKSDNNATIAAARFTYAGLLRRGIRLFEYQPTKLHTKLYVVDDATWIGSANFDMRSLFVNLELMLDETSPASPITSGAISTARSRNRSR